MPLGASVIEGYGMLGLLFYKLVVTLAVIVCSRRLFTESLWSLLNGAFAGVVMWNNIGLAANCFTLYCKLVYQEDKATRFQVSTETQT